MPSTPPAQLPTAVLLQEDTDLARSVLKRWRTPPTSASRTSSAPSRSRQIRCSLARCCWRRDPARVRARVRLRRATWRCWWPPTPPTRWRPARRWRREQDCADSAGARPRRRRRHAAAVRGAAHAATTRPAPRTEHRAGLTGTIPTLTMLIFTALSVTRELDAAPWRRCCRCRSEPVEVMLGEIIRMC